MRRALITALVVVSALAAGCSSGDTAPAPTAPATAPAELTPRVVEVLPHDTTAFTQGLELVDGVLYEGTGLVGRSSVRATDPRTGAVRTQVDLPDPLFGEGITVVDDSLWQLTWQDGVAVQRDRSTLAERRRVAYDGEGWGLCHDRAGGRLVMSDGSDRLVFRDPDTFDVTGEVRVSAAGEPVERLNELECTANGVYANVWQTDTVVRIDPSSGRVTARVDLAGLLTPDERAHTDVLNGIAAVPDTDEFLVTGKLWPKLFRVSFVPR